MQERELEGAQESGNVNVLCKEIDKLQTDKREVDNELRRLREEQQAMHMQSTSQTKLDMLAKDKSNKEDAIQKMWENVTRASVANWFILFHLTAFSHACISDENSHQCSVDRGRKRRKYCFFKRKHSSVDGATDDNLLQRQKKPKMGKKKKLVNYKQDDLLTTNRFDELRFISTPVILIISAIFLKLLLTFFFFICTLNDILN